jgi:hypothetical protein
MLSRCFIYCHVLSQFHHAEKRNSHEVSGGSVKNEAIRTARGTENVSVQRTHVQTLFTLVRSPHY